MFDRFTTVFSSFSVIPVMAKTADDLKGEFAVIYEENHAGTFNGVLETVGRSLEDWVNRQITHYVPGVVLDHRTNMHTKTSFLRGQDAYFMVQGATPSFHPP